MYYNNNFRELLYFVVLFFGTCCEKVYCCAKKKYTFWCNWAQQYTQRQQSQHFVQQSGCTCCECGEKSLKKCTLCTSGVKWFKYVVLLVCFFFPQQCTTKYYGCTLLWKCCALSLKKSTLLWNFRKKVQHKNVVKCCNKSTTKAQRTINVVLLWKSEVHQRYSSYIY